MFSTPVPAPKTKGAPGRASWCTTRPASTSALATATQAASDAGPCAPADTDAASTSGHLELGAHERLVAADGVEHQRRRGHGEAGEAAGLAAAAAISAIVCSEVAAERAGDDDGLARALEHRGELGHVDQLVGRRPRAAPMDMTKSTLGSASATAAARVTSSSRARRRSPLSGSRDVEAVRARCRSRSARPPAPAARSSPPRGRSCQLRGAAAQRLVHEAPGKAHAGAVHALRRAAAHRSRARSCFISTPVPASRRSGCVVHAAARVVVPDAAAPPATAGARSLLGGTDGMDGARVCGRGRVLARARRAAW